MTTSVIKTPLLDLIPCTSDKIGILNIVQIILQLGQLTNLFFRKTVFGKGIDGKERVYLTNRMGNKTVRV